MVSTQFLFGHHFVCFLAFLLTRQGSASCSSVDSVSSCSAQTSRSLLQVSADRRIASIGSSTQTKYPASMPPQLVELGTRLFGSAAAMESVLAQSSCGPMTYANVNMQICVAAGDNAKSRLPGEDGEGYGLDTLLDLGTAGTNGMINMLDFGGNYGVVTIATFMKYPGKVRAVVAEPVPTTFFFLCWNMYLNNVPVVDEIAFRKGGNHPGVVALQKAVSGPGDSVLRICSHPVNSMDSYLSLDSKVCKCHDDVTPCHEVPVASSHDMFGMFGSEDITLLKMDCEGCEKSSFPPIANGPSAGRVKRLSGELHNPDPSLVQLACKYDNAKYMTAWCERLVKPEDWAITGGANGRVDGSDICVRCVP